MSEPKTVDDLVDQLPPVPHAQMPREIAAAVIKVKKQVKQLGQDGENKFAKFNYVSVDKFYDVIGRLMAEAGIFVVTDELSISADTREAQLDGGGVKKSVWITAAYALWLFHESGAQYGPVHRTIMVPATGPQAFGSGMSYVEKYFLRSLFKVPTGEEDADATEQTGIPYRNGERGDPMRGIISAEQEKEIHERIISAGADRAKFYDYFGVANLSELPAAKLETARNMLTAFERQKQKKAAVI